ncbi:MULTISPECIES: DUF805 domain-containing protein [unclassified Maridesulfovibrio]|uniref:DUF805 domain-containing protein n=1 Tax=unclassified Maridesulfovibrio TaxID=2794999 RepID=UPI003B3E5EBF
MEFMEAVKICIRKYATFKGRAARPEFWYWVLFTWILSMIAYTIDTAISGSTDPLTRSLLASNIVIFITVIPTMAVSVRRLHDVGRSGWWFLLTFTVIGALLLLYWYVRPSKNNRLVDSV